MQAQERNSEFTAGTITGKMQGKAADACVFFIGKVADAKSCIKILSSYAADSDKIVDAYELLASERNRNFIWNADWYECCAKIYECYEAKYSHDLPADFYQRYFYARERVVACRLMKLGGEFQRETIFACVSAMVAFDELLVRARNFLKEPAFADHMSAQYCFHASTLMRWKSEWVDDDWKECTRSVAPLMKLCRVVDYSEGREEDKGDLDGACASDAKYRNAQAKYMLRVLEGNSCGLEGANWRIPTESANFQRFFYQSEWKPFEKSSYLCGGCAFFEKTPRFSVAGDDSENAAAEYADALKKMRPGSLQHSVWLGLRSCEKDLLPFDFRAEHVDGLPFSSQKLSSVYLENLCQLDVDAFLYFTVFCAQSSSDADNADYFLERRPIILPTDVSTTKEHDEWWMAAYKCAVKAIPSYGMEEAKSGLLRGLRMVRLLPESNLDGRLLAKVGRTFLRRAKTEECLERAKALRQRAFFYWEAAVPALKKMLVRVATTVTEAERYFNYKKKTLENGELRMLVKEGILFLGATYMEMGRLESADKILSQLPDDNWAALFRALIRYDIASRYDTTCRWVYNIEVDEDRRIAAILTQGREFLKKVIAGTADEESDSVQEAHLYLSAIQELFENYLFKEEDWNGKNVLGNVWEGWEWDDGSDAKEHDETEKDDAIALHSEVVNEPFLGTVVTLDGVSRFPGRCGEEIPGSFQLTLCDKYTEDLKHKIDAYEPRATTIPSYTIRVGELHDGKVDSTFEFNLETLRKEVCGDKLVMENDGVLLKLNIKSWGEVADFCSKLDRLIEFLDSKGFRK